MVSNSVLRKIMSLERRRPGRLERIPWLFCTEIDPATGGFTFDWVNIRLAIKLGFVAKLERAQPHGTSMVLQLARTASRESNKVRVFNPETRETTNVRIRAMDAIFIEPEEADEGRHVHSEIDSG